MSVFDAILCFKDRSVIEELLIRFDKQLPDGNTWQLANSYFRIPK